MSNDDGTSRPDDDSDPAAGSTPDDRKDVFAYGDPGKRKADKQKNIVRRHPVVLGLVVLLALIVGSVGAFALYLNNQLGGIDRFDVAGGLEDRPDKVDNESLNILLAGVDKGDGRSVKQLVEDGWESGVFRSDTIMILHVTADRDHAYLVSVPRDSYVKIFDENGNYQEKNKINAALSIYGPTGYLATIEKLTDLRMDHFAAVDWNGFKDISSALGGVEVYIPETFYDSSQKRQWIEGPTTLEGEDALAYVRTRYDLPDDSGDFGRIARQQNFMRAMVGKMLSQGTLANPLKLTEHAAGRGQEPHRRPGVRQRRDPRPGALAARHPHRGPHVHHRPDGPLRQPGRQHRRPRPGAVQRAVRGDGRRRHRRLHQRVRRGLGRAGRPQGRQLRLTFTSATSPSAATT